MRVLTVGILGLVLAFGTLPSVRAEDPPAVGDPAPDFTLQDAAGEDVTLSSFRGEHHVLVAFYPRDFTPG
jgi:peroxiredoxin